ncbi:hypothetical protein CF326_g5178, partial [Tilletia indica]
MLQEETASLTQGARRRVGEDNDWLRSRLPKVRHKLEERYGSKLVSTYLKSDFRSSNGNHLVQSAIEWSQPQAVTPESSMNVDSASDTDVRNGTEWPKPIEQSTKDKCVQDFREGTNLEIGPTCAVCSIRTFSQDLLYTKTHVTCVEVEAETLPLDLLQIKDEHLLGRPEHHFEYGHPTLSYLALDREGVRIVDGEPFLNVCSTCLTSLRREPPALPALALANNNIRGYLPDHLRDLTWFEERLCARYLASVHVVRLYDLTSPGAPEHRARVMKGHACSFPLNTISTAAKLPWAIGDGGALVSCIVIGPRKPRLSDLRHVFKVRRQKVKDFLEYLQDHFKGFPQLSIDEEALRALPDNDVPELIMRHVVHQHSGDVPSLFDSETTGIQQHLALDPSNDVDDILDEGRTLLEHHGMVDINGMSIPAHERVANALVNLTGARRPEGETSSTLDSVVLSSASPTEDQPAIVTGSERPDLIIKHGSSFIQEYKNPALFPGMFPTLFPWGTGGFESEREVPLSFGRQASHLLDISDPSFRTHWSFIFVTCNIKQRRAIHVGSSLACKTRDHDRIVRALQSVDKHVVQSVAQHLAEGGRLRDLTADEATIFTLLKRCEIVSAHVQGSKAIMNRARAEIRGYIGQFGIFQLFLTLNPRPSDSPVFQIFFGDKSVSLKGPNMHLPPTSTRATRVADDPVSASDFFHFHIAAVFQFLFGWDVRKKQSTETGGILGRLAAFFLVKEHTMRGQLHGHILLWLEGGINPGKLRALMQDDTAFRERYLAFFDDLIAHHLPPVTADQTPADVISSAPSAPSSNDEGQVEHSPDDDRSSPTPARRHPQSERPPDTKSTTYRQDFTDDHRLLGETLQRHKCQVTCFKGGRTSCRFLFPHEINPEPYFDPESKSIHLRITDPTVNWHNPTLLVATRHNHDLKAVQSGRSGLAAASYITSYTTKSDETPENQISMINTVFQRQDSDVVLSADVKGMLTRCVMQFGRERQLHAQQVATYVRDLGDTMQSHKTVPMLSGRMLHTVLRICGPIKDDDTDSSSPEHSSIAMDVDQANQQETDDNGEDHEETNSVDDVEEDDDEDQGFHPLSTSGKAQQTEDYLHRGESLSHLTFYDFVRTCSMVKMPKKLNKHHHLLKASHPNANAFCHSWKPSKPVGIPRAIFS